MINNLLERPEKIEMHKLTYEGVRKFETVINDLRKNAVFIGLQLKENILQDVIRFSKNSKLWSRHERRGFSDFNEVHRFNKDNQRHCCLLHLTDPKLEKLSNSIARDKNLLRIANNYLGRVNKIDATVVFALTNGNFDLKIKIR